MEIMVSGSAQPINAVAKIDARQVAREDFVFRQPGLEPKGDNHFLRLALDRSVARQEIGLGELLGNRAAALPDPAAAQVGIERPPDPAGIDSPMAVKSPVLDRDEGGGSQAVQFRDVD